MGPPPPLHPTILPLLSREYIDFHYSHALHHPPLEVTGWSVERRSLKGPAMGREPVEVEYAEVEVRSEADTEEEFEGEWAIGGGKGGCGIGVFAPKNLPRDHKLPIFTYIAGGGFVFPSPTTSSFLTRIARDTPCILLIPRPRVAPEHPWPAGLEDDWGIVRWVLDGRAERDWNALGLSVKTHALDWAKVALGGASAGGNVAAIIAEKLTRPAFKDLTPLRQLLLFNPVLDATASPNDCAYPSWSENQHCPDLPALTMLAFWQLYLPKASPPFLTHPLLSPALAPASILARLPKLWVCEGNADLVRDEGLVFARRVREAKGLDEGDESVQVKVYEGATHGYTIQDGVLEVGRMYIEDVKEVLRRAFD